MEDELKCPVCKQLYNNPVLLPCYHSLCLKCAIDTQQPATKIQPRSEESLTSNLSEVSSDNPDMDKVSILSETDSGVMCNSRPDSFNDSQSILFPPLQSNAISLKCTVCNKIVYFDENGAHNLPKNKTMQNIVDKYVESKNLLIKCQLCESEPKEASVMCEQCEVFYCDSCREDCHPSRGPLAKHNLLSPQEGKAVVRVKNKGKDSKCVDHGEDSFSMYCMMCKTPLCSSCIQDGRHLTHDVQAITAICKAQKTELSQMLQALSEKAKTATEFLQRLKIASDSTFEQSEELELEFAAQCEALVSAVHARRMQLIEFVHTERDFKLHTLKDQVGVSTHKLQQTTGLLHYCIEALKETDFTAFLQIGNALINRVTNVDISWQKNLMSAPLHSYQIDLTLDDAPVLRAIEQLNFIQLKSDNECIQHSAPGPPIIIPEDCSAENNSVTIAWQPSPSSFIEGYVLELDDGKNGAFREVYCGKETICTVDGLHFNSVYNARVKAFNNSDEGPYSKCICLQTAEVAWFTFNPAIAHQDLTFSNDNLTVASESYEHRVVVGIIGFSHGTHYWEFTIDRYDSNTDVVFGVARFDVNKEIMLGKDDKGWGMYIDNQRSWFLHCDKHEHRTEGGIKGGFVVGVVLDLNNHRMRFYVNQELHGPVAFSDLYGVFYPAVSINRSVSLTLRTGLDPPIDQESGIDDT